MMNMVALSLVLSSLVTAGVWSPSQKPNIAGTGGGEEVIVKEGHRVVVVEYDPETDGNTKVLISPQDTHVSHHAKEKLSSVTGDAKGKAKETLDEAKEKAKEATNGRDLGELVCDAFGKCKHKIASAMGRAKDKASEAYHEMTEKAHKVEEQAKDKASETLGKTKDRVSGKVEDMKGTVSDKAQQVGGGVKEAVDTAKTIGNDVAKNFTSKLDEATETVERAKEEGERELGEIFGRGRDLAKDVWSYLVSSRLVGSAMGVVHLLGFATAYGMCVWVTFVSSYVLAGALPRQQFGMVQSKVYPVYFSILAYTVMVALVGHLYGEGKRLFSNTVGMAQAYSLLGSFAMVLFNLLYLEPRATRVMFERMKMEKEEGRGRVSDSFLSDPTAKLAADNRMPATPTTPATAAGAIQEKSEATDDATMLKINNLGEKLKKLNSYSSFLNVLTLVALTSHLAYLGQRLHVTC